MERPVRQVACNLRSMIALLGAIVVALGFAGPAQAALVEITGGSSIGIPSSNNVLGPAGIRRASQPNRGSIIKNGTLNITSPGVTLTL